MTYAYLKNSNDLIINLIASDIQDSTRQTLSISNANTVFSSVGSISNFENKFGQLLYKYDPTKQESENIAEITPPLVDIKNKLLAQLNNNFDKILYSDDFIVAHGHEMKANTGFHRWAETKINELEITADITADYACWTKWRDGRLALYTQLTTKKTWVKDAARTYAEYLEYDTTLTVP